MTDASRKEQVYRLIRADPFISQQELAERLGLSRSAVAGHIAGLTREGRLLGRAYVLPNDRPVLCIGGANIDRKMRSAQRLQMGTSNPVSQQESWGGVARNLAENLARLGLPTALLTAVSDDAAGRALLAHAESAGIDPRGSLQAAGMATGSYTAILDDDGGLVLALAHMEALDGLTPDFLAARAAQRQAAAMTIADLNLPADSVRMLLADAARGGSPLVLVAVSRPKMSRLPADLAGLRLLVLNEGELEERAGRRLDTPAKIVRACRALRDQGVQDIVVTRGADGLIHTTADGVAELPAPRVPVVDVTGAGDALAAGICWSLHRDGDNLALACRRGLALAARTVQSPHSVVPDPEPSLLAAIAA